MSVLEFRVGDVVRLRKAHPCGGLVWTVLRLGADIGLRCNTLRSSDAVGPRPVGETGP